MDRKEALDEIAKHVQNKNMIKHMLAAEAVMRALARRFGANEDEWGMAGLLHDIDIELTEGDLSRHAKEGAEMAKRLGASEAVAHAILCHNVNLGVSCEDMLDRALFAADPLTGLITAAVLVRPDRSIAALEAKSVCKRFREKGFAAGANREQIAACSELGLELDEFADISLKAMQEIAGQLGF